MTSPIPQNGTVIDLGSRRLLGWSMSDRHDATLVVDALEAAVAARGRVRMPGTIFHSDRGAEYTSNAFRAACQRLGLRQSASRTGSCLDNAVAETWFATLKVELVNRHRYRTRAQGRTAIFAWCTTTMPAGCTPPWATAPPWSGNSNRP